MVENGAILVEVDVLQREKFGAFVVWFRYFEVFA